MAFRLPAWLGPEDYVLRKAAAARAVVRRFARGNVALQEGRYVTADELKRRSEAAVVSMANIERLMDRR